MPVRHQQLRSRFDWLRDPDPDAVATPPLYMAFDLLYATGATRPPGRCDRRARLEDVVTGGELVFPLRRLSPDGLEARAQVLERGHEGLVAKDEASPYVGGRTRAWLEVKVPGVPPAAATEVEESPRTACLDHFSATRPSSV